MAALRADRSQAGRTTVLLIDSSRLRRESLGFVLQQDEDLAVVCSSAEEAPAQIRQQQPSVVLMSFGSDHEDGVQLLASLRAEHLNLAVLVLAPNASDQTVFAYARAGASGCLTESTTPAALAHAIKEVAGGEILFSPVVLGRLLRLTEAAPVDVRTPLGLRELQVLREFATGAGVDDVAARLEIRPHTVRTHMKNILAKLDAHSRLEAVMTAFREGWIEIPEPAGDRLEPAG